jgi:riboflavin kinase/FMN adenylyltransferase
LLTLEERIEAFAGTGIDRLLILPFTKEFSRWSSERFIEDILVKTIGIQRIVIGYDHHFGKNRTGGLKDLQVAGLEHGFEVEEIPAEQVDNANVSSTKIRKALMEGDIATANRFLAYPYPFRGMVVHGQKLGRQLGFPTANIQSQDPYKLIPAEGVYLAAIDIDGQQHMGMLNIGRKPTVGADFPVGVEMHIFQFDADIYDKEVTVRFWDWIREDRKFGSLEELVNAIRADQAACEARIRLLKERQSSTVPSAPGHSSCLGWTGSSLISRSKFLILRAMERSYSGLVLLPSTIL